MSCSELWEVQHLCHSTLLSVSCFAEITNSTQLKKKCVSDSRGMWGRAVILSLSVRCTCCPDISLTVIRKALVFCLATLVKRTIWLSLSQPFLKGLISCLKLIVCSAKTWGCCNLSFYEFSHWSNVGHVVYLRVFIKVPCVDKPEFWGLLVLHKVSSILYRQGSLNI